MLLQPPASLIGPTCMSCGTPVASPRVECAPGVNFCVYCAEWWAEEIKTTYPDARVAIGNMGFRLHGTGEE